MAPKKQRQRRPRRFQLRAPESSGLPTRRPALVRSLWRQRRRNPRSPQRRQRLFMRQSVHRAGPGYRLQPLSRRLPSAEPGSHSSPRLQTAPRPGSTHPHPLQPPLLRWPGPPRSLRRTFPPQGPARAALQWRPPWHPPRQRTPRRPLKYHVCRPGRERRLRSARPHRRLRLRRRWPAGHRRARSNPRSARRRPRQRRQAPLSVTSIPRRAHRRVRERQPPRCRMPMPPKPVEKRTRDRARAKVAASRFRC
jgi:hypothetical protein